MAKNKFEKALIKRDGRKITKKNISYIDDILVDVFNHYEYMIHSKKQFKELVEIYFEYIAKETDNKDVFSMELPCIGTLYKNTHLLKNRRRYLATDDRDEIDSQINELVYFRDEINHLTPHRRTPISFSYYPELKEEYDVERPYTKDRQSLEILLVAEEIQNKTNR